MNEYTDGYANYLNSLDRTHLDKEIVQCLVALFRGDTDKIQSWLEIPNTHLDEKTPSWLWSYSRKEAARLLRYLEEQKDKYPDGV